MGLVPLAVSNISPFHLDFSAFFKGASTWSGVLAESLVELSD